MVVWPLRAGEGSTGSAPPEPNPVTPCVHPAPLPLPHRGGGVHGPPTLRLFREDEREERGDALTPPRQPFGRVDVAGGRGDWSLGVDGGGCRALQLAESAPPYLL